MLLPYTEESVLLLGIALVVSIVVGSLPMIVVSALLLAVFAGLAYRARVIKRNLASADDPHRRD